MKFTKIKLLYIVMFAKRKKEKQKNYYFINILLKKKILKIIKFDFYFEYFHIAANGLFVSQPKSHRIYSIVFGTMTNNTSNRC